MSTREVIAINNTQQDAWQSLKQFTNARIAVGRTGTSIPLEENLQFKADHARARDAVYATLDTGSLTDALAPFCLPILHLQSDAKDRSEYLQRPDKGRKLHKSYTQKIKASQNFDIAIIIADGLSAKAVQLYTQPVLQHLLQKCSINGFTIAPLCIIQQARVAIGDEAGMLLKASLSVVLIGERPGLSSPHSMGIYLTYNPVIGLTDESRYCISNIHTPGGLTSLAAADQAFALIRHSFSTKLSGVHAKQAKISV